MAANSVEDLHTYKIMYLNILKPDLAASAKNFQVNLLFQQDNVSKQKRNNVLAQK